MKKFISIMLICFIISAAACSDTAQPDTPPVSEGALSVIDPNVDGVISETSISGDSIYYTSEQSEHQAQFHHTTTIHRVEPDNKTTEELLVLPFSDYGYVRELCSCKDFVFFTSENISSGRTALWKYTASTKKLEQIYSTDHLFTTAFEYPYLIWYEVENADNVRPNEGLKIEAVMKIYDASTGVMEQLDDSHILVSPYQRPRIIDGTVTYFTIEHDSSYVNVYDLRTDKLIRKINIEDTGDRAMSSSDYIVYTRYLPYGKKRIEVIPLQNQSPYSIPDEIAGEYYNYDLQDDCLHLFRWHGITKINLDSNESQEIFQTEGIMGYGVGERDGYALALLLEGKNSIIYSKNNS